MIKSWVKQKGFTIVELLIVIVIIGILAALVIISYNAIQGRARNAAVVAGVDAYQKALKQYAIDHQAYPNIWACLGANYPGDQCWSGSSGNFYINSTTDAQLAPYLSSKPTLSTNRILAWGGPDYRAGAVLINSGGVPPYKIMYYLEGASQKCIDGSIGFTYQNSTQCTIILDDPTSF